MRRARPVLLSAFEPFGGSATNASLEVLRHLETAEDIETLVLPVTRWEAQKSVLERLSRPPAPIFYVALGEAGPERIVRLEKVAINWDDYRIPDNGGNQPLNESIVPDGPDAYFATVDVARIEDRLHGATPLPVRISLSAGSFLCNHLAYAVSHRLAPDPICPFVFIHLPSWRPQEEGLEDLVTTVREILTAISEIL